MGQGTGRGRRLAQTPRAIRARIKATRTALGQKLNELHDRVLGTQHPTTTGVSKMAKKKKSAGKKESGAGKKNRKKSRSRGGMMSKEVKAKVGEVLTGAAVGAVEGAVEALKPAGANAGPREEASGSTEENAGAKKSAKKKSA